MWLAVSGFMVMGLVSKFSLANHLTQGPSWWHTHCSAEMDASTCPCPGKERKLNNMPAEEGNEGEPDPRTELLQEGGPKLDSCLTLKNELSQEAHVLTKQEILLGEGT